jgi:hypothetical protein
MEQKWADSASIRTVLAKGEKPPLLRSVGRKGDDYTFRSDELVEVDDLD